MHTQSSHFSYCITAEVLIASAITVSTALGKSSLVSSLFALSFCVLLVFLVLSRSWSAFNFNVFLLLSLCVYHVVMNNMMNEGKISFDYMKKLIMFSAFIILLDYAAKIRISQRALTAIKTLPVVAGTFLVCSYYFLGNTGRIAGGVTLGFSNPNFTGMWLLHFVLFGVLFVLEGIQGDRQKLLFIPILILLIKLLWDTLTRSCMISLFFFVGMLALRIVNKRMKRIVIIAIAVFPFAYMIVYLSIVNTDWFRKTFSFMVSAGKALNSRVWIWERALSFFKEHPITGDYFGISGGGGQSQLHNTHVDTMCSYGTVPFLLFIRFLDVRMTKVNQKIDSFYQYTALCAFCAVLIQGAFEAAVVAGAMGLNLLTVALLALANSSDGEQVPTVENTVI